MHINSSIRCVFFSAGFIGASLVSLPLLAEELESSEELESVVVSASALSTEKQALAVSLSRLSADDLKAISATHPNEIAAHVPGAWVSRGDGQEHLTAIRSPVFTGAGACGAFFIAEDSISVRAPGFCNVNQLFDTHYEFAQGFEVFRGPSSSVFGSNALFGGINVISPDNTTPNSVGLELGSYDFKRLQFNVVDAEKKNQAYATITDTGSFRADADYKQQKLGLKHYSDYRGWKSTSSIQLSNLEQETAGFIEGFESYLDRDAREENSFPEAFRDVRSLRAYSKWEKLDGETLTLIQPYLRIHRMQFLMHFVPWQPLETNQHDSIGLKLLHSRRWLENMTIASGIDLEYTSGELEEFQAEPAPFSQDNFPVGTHYDYEVVSNSVSPYFELRYTASDRLQLSSQFRWELLQYDYTNNTGDGFACEDDATACRFFRPESGKDTFSSPSVRLGFVFDAASSIDVFGNIATAYRAPHTAELYRAQSDLQSGLDTVSTEGVDIGIRDTEGRLRYELNIFSMTQDDAIYQDTERQYLVGAETSHEGLEFDVDLAVSETWSIGATGSYAEHKYRNSPEQLDIALDITGNDIDTAPELIYGVRSTLQLQRSRVELLWNSIGSHFIDPANEHEYDGHDLLNLSSVYELADGAEIQLNVNNVLDTAYAERADISFGEYRYFPGAGRTVRLGYRQYF